MMLRAHALAIAASTLLALGAAHAQDASPQKMVGTWQGKVDVHDEPERTLVVKSITREGDIWIASIEYGPTGKKLSVLPARVDTQRGAMTLSFPISATSKVELSLVSESELRGLLKISSEGGWVGRKMRLQKIGDKP
jgi:hypothetical protein